MQVTLDNSAVCEKCHQPIDFPENIVKRAYIFEEARTRTLCVDCYNHLALKHRAIDLDWSDDELND